MEGKPSKNRVRPALIYTTILLTLARSSPKALGGTGTPRADGSDREAPPAGVLTCFAPSRGRAQSSSQSLLEPRKERAAQVGLRHAARCEAHRCRLALAGSSLYRPHR